MFGLSSSNDRDELRYLLDVRVEYQPLFGKGTGAPLEEERRPDSRERRLIVEPT